MKLQIAVGIIIGRAVAQLLKNKAIGD